MAPTMHSLPLLGGFSVSVWVHYFWCGLILFLSLGVAGNLSPSGLGTWVDSTGISFWVEIVYSFPVSSSFQRRRLAVFGFRILGWDGMGWGKKRDVR
jgi:hypothetical protein